MGKVSECSRWVYDKVAPCRGELQFALILTGNR